MKALLYKLFLFSTMRSSSLISGIYNYSMLIIWPPSLVEAAILEDINVVSILHKTI